jgi:hypothetical protein
MRSLAVLAVLCVIAVAVAAACEPPPFRVFWNIQGSLSDEDTSPWGECHCSDKLNVCIIFLMRTWTGVVDGASTFTMHQVIMLSCSSATANTTVARAITLRVLNAGTGRECNGRLASRAERWHCGQWWRATGAPRPQS